MKPITRTTALALTVLGLAVTPAADAAKPVKVSKARFAITIDGVQRTTWTTDHKADGIGGCDAAYTASGSEKVRFTSSATTIRALSLPTLSAPVLSQGTGSKARSPKFRLRGSVTRASAHNSAPVDNGCGGSERGPTAKDCGTKKFSGLKAVLDYRLSAKVKDSLEVRNIEGEDPFKACGGGGTTLPTLLTTNNGKMMNLRMPRRELFNRKLGKIILIGRARENHQEGEHKYTTTTRWVITLVRK